MIVLVGLLSFILLGVLAVRAKKRGLSGWEVALLILVCAAFIVVALFGVLVWGFSGFG